MATHSSTLAWKIPWTEEPGRLQSMGSRRVRHNWATSLSGIEEGNPLQCSCLENPRDDPGGLPPMGSHRVGHDWSDLAAAAAVPSTKAMAPVNGVNAKLCPSPWLSGMGRQLQVQKKKKKLLSQHPGQQSHPEPSLFQTPLVLTLPSAGTLSPILLVKEDLFSC